MQPSEIIRRIIFRLQGRVLHFTPKGKPRGHILFSYVTLPFLNKSERILSGHTNRWECLEICRLLVGQGYTVDVIDITDTSFIPKRKYDYFIDNGQHMERLAPLFGDDCIKIFHATTAHWKFNNEAEQKRFDDLFARRGVNLKPDRALPPNRAIELCNIATMLGNDFTASTYAFAGKEVIRIPISTTHTYPSPEHKDFEGARKNFIWFGGAGVIHKGLDLVVEAFAQMPEYNLTICGKIEGEKDFLQIYAKELALPNITIAGFTDPASREFKELCAKSIALVYPSCSEGQSGGVVLTMHAGLIPIVSFESGVDVNGFGVILKENTLEEIKNAVAQISNTETPTLKRRSVTSWEYTNTHHTRETFTRTYGAFVDMLGARYQV